jgi:murein DD-endopeptidase MepM/ murein hydrolase activator NlpD
MVKISIIIFSLLFFVSCTTSGPAIFGKQSLHEQYGKKLSNAGLKETALGRSWFTEAEKALSQPLSVTLPFKQRGYFAPDKPRAIGLAFTAKRGSKLVFSLVQNPVNGFVIYGELWRRATNGDYKLLSSLDTAQSGFSYVAEDVSTLILRLQPELLGSGEYTLSIAVEPSLGFPVPGKSARVGSVWGDRRDAGARSHEGIDIFAPKRTPVVASANGTVNRVEETAIGGKVVWLKPDGQPLNLYYAHLDEQLVSAGQNVKAGDTLGLIGNTGNARTTPAHLHFGVYGFGGAVDPLPFVNPAVQNAPPVNSTLQLNRYFRTVREIKSETDGVINKYTPVFITDVSSAFLYGRLPDGTNRKLLLNSVQTIDNQLSTISLRDSLPIKATPSFNAPLVKNLPPKTVLRVLGHHNNYSFVETEKGETGWVEQTASR